MAPIADRSTGVGPLGMSLGLARGRPTNPARDTLHRRLPYTLTIPSSIFEFQEYLRAPPGIRLSNEPKARLACDPRRRRQPGHWRCKYETKISEEVRTIDFDFQAPTVDCCDELTVREGVGQQTSDRHCPRERQRYRRNRQFGA